MTDEACFLAGVPSQRGDAVTSSIVEKLQGGLKIMGNIKMRRMFMPLALAILMVAATFGAAFAAMGDTFLGDFYTLDTVRPNTYDADYGVEEYEYGLAIIKLVENASGDYIPEFFDTATEADPSNFAWEQNTPDMYNLEIEGTGEAREMSTGNWYYSISKSLGL
ncbi:MAG: hypothetical protein LBS75_03575 [Synergistaceae bacterium]|jgi:hypothetical protein|nr:hypothetical protein [Synergistaceae bacterium]